MQDKYCSTYVQHTQIKVVSILMLFEITKQADFGFDGLQYNAITSYYYYQIMKSFIGYLINKYCASIIFV